MPFIQPDKNRHQYIIGIDFGHGETSVAIAQIDWDSPYDKLGKVFDVELDGKNSIYSCFVQSKSDCNNVFVGHKAYTRAHQKESATNDYTWDFHAYFKDTPSKLLADGQLDVMKTFMHNVYEKVLALKGNDGGPLTRDNHLVYIACPSSSEKWTVSEVEAYANLASEAGLPLCKIDGFTNGIIRESRAAFICARNQPHMRVSDGILIVDFGSSTVDFTYYSSTLPKPIDDGVELGAQRIEELILDDISTSFTEVKTLCESERIKKSLLLAIRQAKEDFYNGESVCDLVVNLNLRSLTGRPDAPKVTQFYSSEEIDTMSEMKVYQTSIKTAFEKFKSHYLSEKNVPSIFLTGGASKMSWVKDIAKSVFGEEVRFAEEIGDNSTVISRGIALAGRADVRTILLPDLPDPEDFDRDIIIDDIIDKAADIFSKEAFDSIKSKVSDFKEDSTNRSINTLRSWVEDSLKKISLNYAVSTSYDTAIRRKINDDILPKINDLIHEYYSPNVTINLPNTLKLSGLEVINLSWSVDKVDEVCFKEVKDILLTKVVKGCFNIMSTLTSIGCNILKYLGNKIEGYERFEYVDPEDYWIEFTKPTTILDTNQRSRVYDAFMAAESAIKSRLKLEIIYQCNEQNINEQIINAYEIDVKSFIDSSIKEARLMLD